MAIFGRSSQKHKMKTATTMVTRPMHLDTPIDYAERSGAAFLPTLESHVLVPLFEAIISGLFFGLTAGAIVTILYLFGDGSLWDSFIYGFIAFVVVTLGWSWWSWGSHLGDYKSLLWYTEFANGPESVEQNKQVHQAEVKINNNWVYADLPFDREKPLALVEFAKAVSQGLAPFSERGAGRYGYGVMYFNELRDNFIKSRMAYWKNPRNKREGVGLNASGYALLRKVADNPPPPNYEPPEDWGMSPRIVQK